MIIRVQDSGEPGFEDNLRFELFEGNDQGLRFKIHGAISQQIAIMLAHFVLILIVAILK
jgi:hypothetical protein